MSRLTSMRRGILLRVTLLAAGFVIGAHPDSRCLTNLTLACAHTNISSQAASASHLPCSLSPCPCQHRCDVRLHEPQRHTPTSEVVATLQGRPASRYASWPRRRARTSSHGRSRGPPRTARTWDPSASSSSRRARGTCRVPVLRAARPCGEVLQHLHIGGWLSTPLTL